MIIGIGTDIIEVDRVKKAVDRWGEEFLTHIFNPEEIEYAKNRKFPFQHYAARFAAKEAVYKAFGDNKRLTWKDMTIINDEHGRPVCRMKEGSQSVKIFLSISHTSTHAMASAVIEKNP